ncbi:hypothetical protein BDR06DRAFT_1030625 [Suillus hirtellus]|nr:hypothetical protein BDR06DRAFT_1030625 [Suillus hirtellus]
MNHLIDMLVILCLTLLAAFLLLGSYSFFIISMLLLRCWIIVFMESLFKMLILFTNPLFPPVLSLLFLLMYLLSILQFSILLAAAIVAAFDFNGIPPVLAFEASHF